MASTSSVVYFLGLLGHLSGSLPDSALLLLLYDLDFGKFMFVRVFIGLA